MIELRDLAISLLADSLRIYSPSKKEGSLSRFLMEKMSNELGYRSVRVDGANNVIGEVGAGKPVLLLCGHMDTVPGVQPVRVKKDLVYGRGVVDAKSSLIAMIVAASSLKKANVGRTILAAVTDEEGSGSGIKELIRGGISADYAIFGEPSGVHSITVGYKGRMSIKVTCQTSPVHASAPWMSQNAIEKGFEVWSAIKTHLGKLSNGANRYASLTACLTRIRAGTAENIMPGTCQFTIDVRYPSRFTSQDVSREVHAAANSLQENPDFPKTSIEIGDSTPPFEASKSSTVSRALARAIIKTRKVKPIYLHKTGTGDMNILGAALNIPVVTYGPGNPHLSHTSKECIEVEEYLSSINIYIQTIKNLKTMLKE